MLLSSSLRKNKQEPENNEELLEIKNMIADKKLKDINFKHRMIKLKSPRK
jgi:hypothetical protein